MGRGAKQALSKGIQMVNRLHKKMLNWLGKCKPKPWWDTTVYFQNGPLSKAPETSIDQSVKKKEPSILVKIIGVLPVPLWDAVWRILKY